MPAVLPAAEDVLAVKGIQIHHVEAAGVVGLRGPGRDLRKECRIGVRDEAAEALDFLSGEMAYRQEQQILSIFFYWRSYLSTFTIISKKD